MKQIFEALLREMEEKRDSCLVTVVKSSGSAPRGAGSQMLVGGNGRIAGTIGGGAVEHHSEETGVRCVAEKSSLRRSYALHERGEQDIGMVCGGEVEVLFTFVSAESPLWAAIARTVLERIETRKAGWLLLENESAQLLDGEGAFLSGAPVSRENSLCLPIPIGERVFLFGAGHCGRALAPVLHSVGFRVTVFDPRAECANREHFPTAEDIFVGDFANLPFKLTDEDYAVVLTDGHSHDFEVEDQLLRGDFAYLGVIGSRKKIAAVNERLLSRGISPEMLERVHTPIGTPIKAVTPEEIAVSIAGEMILVRATRRENAGVFLHGCPMR